LTLEKKFWCCGVGVDVLLRTTTVTRRVLGIGLIVHRGTAHPTRDVQYLNIVPKIIGRNMLRGEGYIPFLYDVV
jgi:hypothetical protein